MAFSTFTVLYNQQLCVVAERFRHPSRSPCSHWWSPRILRPSPCTVALDLPLLDVSHVWNWESQFLHRLIRSPGSPRRRKGSGAFREKEVCNPQGGGKDKHLFFFSLHSLVLVKNVFFFKREPVITQQTTQFKLCAKDYKTTMYPAWGQFLLPETLLTNPVILKCTLWEWVW